MVARMFESLYNQNGMAQKKTYYWLQGVVDPEKEKDNPLLTWLWCGALFLIGMILWGYFLNFGTIPFDFHDWAEVNAPRLAFLKDAVTKGVLPLHMQDASALRGVTDRFMALPDVILSPQIILLRWLSVGDFVLVHTWILYALGFLGLYRLKQYKQLSLFSFSWLFFLFNLNGNITAHYAVGHITWGGTFLLSWFALLIFKMLNGDRSWRWVAQMSFLVFFIFLQGSFHQFVWCLLFMGFLALTGVKNLIAILKAGVFSCLLSVVRIIPPALQMSAFDDDFLGGFSSIKQLIRSFVQIIPPADSLNPAETGSFLGWWEFDHYIGFAGVIFLLLFGALWLISHKQQPEFPAILLPIGVIGLFSVGRFYEIFRLLPIPLFTGERVSSRMLILPLIFLMILAVIALQNFLCRQKYSLRAIAIPGILLLAGLTELWRHLESWKVLNAFSAFPYTYTDLAIKTVNNHPDPEYTQGLLIGLIISVLSGIILLVLVRREKLSGRVSS